MYTFEIYRIKIYQFYAQKLGVGMKETMMDTGVGNRQRCKQDQILKTKTKTAAYKTKTKMTRPRPPEGNKGTWRI